LTAVTMISLKIEPRRNIASLEAALLKWRAVYSSRRTTCNTAASTCFAALARSSTAAASSQRSPRRAANRRPDPLRTGRTGGKARDTMFPED
jgi:hypothetical protein